MAALHGSASLDLHRMLATDAGIADLVRSTAFIHVYSRNRRPNRADEIPMAFRDPARRELSMILNAGRASASIEPAYLQSLRAGGAWFMTRVTPRIPGRLVKGLARQVVAASGGDIVQREVRGFDDFGRDRVVAVRTEDNCESKSGEVVIAAGAWSTRLTRMLGFDVPLEAERGYHVTLARPGIEVRHTLMETDRKFVATPMEMGLRFRGDGRARRESTRRRTTGARRQFSRGHDA